MLGENSSVFPSSGTSMSVSMTFTGLQPSVASVTVITPFVPYLHVEQLQFQILNLGIHLFADTIAFPLVPFSIMSVLEITFFPSCKCFCSHGFRLQFIFFPTCSPWAVSNHLIYFTILSVQMNTKLISLAIIVMILSFEQQQD